MLGKSAMLMESQKQSTVQLSDVDVDREDISSELSELSSSSPLICCTPPTDSSGTDFSIGITKAENQLRRSARVIPNREYSTALKDNDLKKSSESLASSNATDSIKDPDYCPSDESTMEEQFQPLSELPVTGELQNSDELQKIAENKENLEERIDEMPSIPVKSSSVGTVEIGNQQIKKSVFCYFCECYVIHFPRHLFRNHANEIEVQRILALPPRSKHRYNLLLDLRKKGNYLNSNAFAKPVRQGNSDSNYLPSTYCFGYYPTKNL
nr:unnamed protein product [Callosobruchus analis]